VPLGSAPAGTVTAALAPPEIWEIVTGTVGDAFTEVGAPKELVGTLVGGGAGGSTGSAVTLAAAPVASELVVALTERV